MRSQRFRCESLERKKTRETALSSRFSRFSLEEIRSFLPRTHQLADFVDCEAGRALACIAKHRGRWRTSRSVERVDVEEVWWWKWRWDGGATRRATSAETKTRMHSNCTTLISGPREAHLQSVWCRVVTEGRWEKAVKGGVTKQSSVLLEIDGTDGAQTPSNVQRINKHSPHTL